jgi:hypothetical protein
MSSHISQLFDRLRNGGFISQNSRQYEQRKLYEYLEDEANFEEARAYFMQINFELKPGQNYFYFSRHENRQTTEDKIERFYKYIDILSFFSNFSSDFSEGKRFSVSDIEHQCKVTTDLKSELDKILREERGIHENSTISEKVTKLVKHMEDRGFFECEDTERQDYKVLSSYNYLLELVDLIDITIPTDDQATA